MKKHSIIFSLLLLPVVVHGGVGLLVCRPVYYVLSKFVAPLILFCGLLVYLYVLYSRLRDVSFNRSRVFMVVWFVTVTIYVYYAFISPVVIIDPAYISCFATMS